MTAPDDRIVRRQLGREPRGSWRVVARCTYGAPTTIATQPALAGMMLFPTLYWLTCPHLVETIFDLESAGGAAEWAERLAGDPQLAGSAMRSDAAYRAARSDEGGGEDPCGDVGIAGQRDPLRTKCLHAHVAARLAGIEDPVGEGVLGGLERECTDGRCMTDPSGGEEG